MREERANNKTHKRQHRSAPQGPFLTPGTHIPWGRRLGRPPKPGRRQEQTHLGDEELAGRELPLAGVHLPVGVHLGALQLLAAVHQRLHLRLHLADVEPGHGELLLDHPVHICQLSTQGLPAARSHSTESFSCSGNWARGSVWDLGQIYRPGVILERVWRRGEGC